jgi:hypothetical protein
LLFERPRCRLEENIKIGQRGICEDVNLMEALEVADLHETRCCLTARHFATSFVPFGENASVLNLPVLFVVTDVVVGRHGTGISSEDFMKLQCSFQICDTCQELR